jgi:two-component system, OmpR family, sensor kinase
MGRAFRSVGARLSLALLLVVAIALGIVYASVVPSLESRLVNTRVSQLKDDAAGAAHHASANDLLLPDFVDTVSASSNSRAVLFELLSPTPQAQLTAMQDSNGIQSSDVQSDPIALKAMLFQRSQHGTVERNDTRYAEAAVFIPRLNATLLLTDSLQNQLSSVHQVQRRMLLAASAALLIALLLGYGGAWAFARRIRRLERAAERIAGGRFDQPVRDSGGDELGELALAFERMRARLAQLDDARREFVANASHELRTPLFSLAGFLELMDDEELDEPTRREFLGSMQEQVERLTKLASDLLDLSRLDAGRLRVEREPVDLTAMGEDLVEEFGPLARPGGHSLQAASDAAVVATGDELRVLQIGRILLENALRHTPPGTPVQVRAVARDGDAVLEVEDEGPGLPAEQLEQLFERFYRLDGTRASGSGLGLAIARQLAELMDGSVEVDSAPGRTVFALVLPRQQHDRRPFPREKPVGVAS